MKNRYEFAADLEQYDNITALDLGCRDKRLKNYLSKNITTYQGIDFEANDEVISANLENGIPLEDKSFDIVYALDVLEHLENMHNLLDEIKRVAKNEAVIALPNCYHWHFKLNMLRNKPIGSKYKVPNSKILDRHRWLTFHQSNLDLINSKWGGNMR